MRGKALFLILVLILSCVSGQVHPTFPGYTPSFGPVSILITSPETGGGLGPKVDLGKEFDLSFKLQVANLTVTDIELQVLMFHDQNESYGPLNDEWIIDSTNTSFEILRGPVSSDGLFRIRISERGYYFLKIRANYSLEGKPNYAEGGDIIMGLRVRVIPSLSRRSYAVLLVMPAVPLVFGIAVRSIRRKETKKRKRKIDPQWLEKLKKEKEESTGDS